MIKVIGICGKKFNGKDTIADHIVKNYGYTKISLGDPIKHALKEIFCFTDEQLWGSKKEIVDHYWNITPRELMQYFGTNCFRDKFGSDYPQIGDNIWVLVLRRKIQKLIEEGITKIIVPDLRFPNEEAVIREFNGTVIRVIRTSININDIHVSENLSEQINSDYVIYNDNIEQLYIDTDNIMYKI